MTIYSLLSILLAFLFTLYIIPKWIYRAKKAKLVGKDIHKNNGNLVAEVGGIPIIAGFLLGMLMYIAFNVFVYGVTDRLYILFAAITTVLIAVLIGFIDDILGWKMGIRQYQKIILTAAIAIPMMVINAGQSVMNIPFFGSIDFGLLYPLLFIPLAIIFTSNSFNMLAGYNGLETGQGILVLMTLSFISYFSGSFWIAVMGVIMSASLFAFLIYNKYPAKIFPGDTMTYTVGTLIGIIVILANIEKFGVIIMILYIVQFFLKAKGKMQKESFGKLKKDGSITNQYDKIYGIEHVVIKFLEEIKVRVTEKKIVYTIWSVQLLVCMITFGYFFCC